MNIVQINAEARPDLGKKAARALRQQGQIPAVLYSKNGVEHFSTKHNDVKHIVFTPEFKLAEITVNGASHKAILKEVTFHPVTDEIVHLDFLKLIDGQTLKANIPVQVKGESPGVKEGGKLMRTLRTVGVKTTPENLVDTLFVDISELQLGFAVRVRDLEIPEGVEVTVDGATPIANVIVPRVMKSEAAEEEGAEGEEGVTEEAPAEGETGEA